MNQLRSDSTRESGIEREPAVLAAEGMVGLLAFENARLVAEHRRLQGELAQARAAIITVGGLVRRRIEQDLHDGAQQRLIGIQIRLELACEREADSELVAELADISAQAELAYDEVRALAHGIYPAPLANRGLAEALRTISSDAPIAVEVIDEGVGRCSPAIAAAVYFCSLEAVQNAIKHAGRAARVRLTLARDRDAVRFEVADDGVGMDVSSYRPGIGLIGMRDRVRAFGGWLDISSSPGRGTCIRGSVPDLVSG
jgi:signal transduction histidine kinase